MIRAARASAILVFLLVAAHPAAAQGPDYPTAFASVRADTPPSIDGRLDEPVWQAPPQVTDMHQLDPGQMTPPIEDTHVWVAHDAEHIYIAARLFDEVPGAILATNLMRRPELAPDDRFSVMLDPFLDRQNGYFFVVNALGQRSEALLENNNRRIWEWDGIWDAAAQVDSRGWTLEMAVPLNTLSFDPSSDAWGINFFRDIARTREFLAWNSEGRQDWNTMPRWGGTVSGLQNLKPGFGLDVVPSLVLTHRDPRGGAGDTNLEPSLDAFYKLTPSLTAALTLNTDFSATEVDDRQVNLDRFSLFFPEKRQFFLQDAGIFEFADLEQNGRPFFSRTIGLSGEGEAIDLAGGGKITGRINEWNLGALLIRQDEFGALDASDLFAARTKYNLGANAYIGGIVTDGDPGSNRDARTTGLDFKWQTTNAGGNTLETGLWAQATETQGAEDGSAWGGALRWPNDRHFAYVEYQQIGDNFDPAMGFVNRSGIRDWRAFYRLRHRPEGGPFLAINQWIWANHITDFDGSPRTQFIDLTPIEFFTRGRDLYNVRVFFQREVLEEPFELFGRVPVPAGDHRFNRYLATVQTAEQRTLQFIAEASTGGFFNGDRDAISATVNWRPDPHFGLAARAELNDISLPGGDFLARVYSLETRVAFNTDWAWITVTQFDNVSNRFGVNSRLRWIPEPGQEYFLVLDHGSLREDGHFRTVSNAATVKLTYTLRF